VTCPECHTSSGAALPEESRLRVSLTKPQHSQTSTNSSNAGQEDPCGSAMMRGQQAHWPIQYHFRIGNAKDLLVGPRLPWHRGCVRLRHGLPWLAHDEAPGPYITIPQYRFNKTKQHWATCWRRNRREWNNVRRTGREGRRGEGQGGVTRAGGRWEEGEGCGEGGGGEKERECRDRMFIIWQPPIGENDDYDNENFWISGWLPVAEGTRREGGGTEMRDLHEVT